jgi:hypothetical protein
MATFNISVVEGVTRVVAESVTAAAATAATQAAASAQSSATTASQARDVAIAAGVQYPSAAAAVAALADGAFGSYLDGSGNPVWGQRTGASMTPLPGPWIGSERVGFQQSGAGAVARTVQAKLRDSLSVTDFGATGSAADFANAATAASGLVTVVPLAGNDAALPADFTNTLFEYNGNSNVRWTHTATVSGIARKKLKAQFETPHQDTVRTALHIETQAIGSTRNGPNSCDAGQIIAIHKQGYAGSIDPISGEIDGLKIFVRQDGAKGQPSRSLTSSDASGILVNIQNVEDCGFTSAWESVTSNFDRGSSSIAFSVQTQIGALDMNNVASAKYGYVAVAKIGALGSAYYAGVEGSSTWANILEAPLAVRINNIGDYSAPNSFWANGAWRISRSAPQNGSTQFTHRGTGALFFLAQDAGAIQFGTNNTIRWEIDSSGQLRPNANLGNDLGSTSRRFSTAWGQAVNLGSTSGDGVLIRSGAGTPEGAVTANVGSIFLRNDGGAGTTLYVKESGTGNTGWVAK